MKKDKKKKGESDISRNLNPRKKVKRDSTPKLQRSSIFDIRKQLKSISNIRQSFWVEVLLNRISYFVTKGRSKDDFEFDKLGVGDYIAIEDKIYTQNTIIKPITIQSLGNMMIRGYLQSIRSQLNSIAVDYNQSNGTNIKIAINEIQVNFNSNVDFQSDKKLQRDYDKVVEERGEGSTLIDDSIVMTYEWLTDNSVDDLNSLWENKTAWEIILYNDVPERLAECYQEVMNKFDDFSKKMKIRYKDLYLTVQQYQRYFSILGYQGKTSLIAKEGAVSNIRSPQQIFSSTDNLVEGNVSAPEGVIVGVNLNSSQTFSIDFSSETYPVITLLSQTTNSGKTFLVQMIIDGMLLQPDLYEPVVIDRKNEYGEFASTSGMRLISFSSSSGQYIDTTEIPTPIGEIEYDNRIATLSWENTTSVYKSLLKHVWRSEIRSALQFVMEDLYESRGFIRSNPDTYKLTSGLTYFSIYTHIDRVITDKPTQAQSRADIKYYQLMKNELRTYFEEGGIASNMFANKLTPSELSDSNGIVFSLDPYSDHKEGIEMELSLLFVSFYISERQLKQRKKQIMLFAEESQELLKIDSFADKLSSLATMGRSGGIKMFFITNAPSIFFGTMNDIENNSKDEMSQSARAIASNMTGAFIGPNSPEDMVQLKKKFSSNETVDVYLDLLAQQTKNPTGSMAHKLIVSDGRTHTFVDVVAHKSLIDMDVYGTRTKFDGVNKKLSLDELRKDALKSTESTYSDKFSKDKDKVSIEKSVDNV